MNSEKVMNKKTKQPAIKEEKINKIACSFRLKKSVVEKIKSISSESDRSESQIVEMAIEQYKHVKK